MSDSFRSHGLYDPWNSPGQSTGVGSLSLLQGIFPAQGSNPSLPALQADSLPAEPQGKLKVMTNLESILKSTDITSSTKARLIQAMDFPVVMYGCESWTIKKAEHRRIDAFELWYWRRLLSPLDCKEIQPVHSEGDQP